MSSIRKAVAAAIITGGALAATAGTASATGGQLGASEACDGTVTVWSNGHAISNIHIIQSTPAGETRTVIEFHGPEIHTYTFDADDYPGFIGVNIKAGNNSQPGWRGKGAWVPVADPDCGPEDPGSGQG